MRTLEEINGLKVWAVDETEECKGCTFNCNEECTKSHDGECVDALRPDKRNVIFQPYEEELKEKTFTLSQLSDIINEIYDNEKPNPHFEAGRRYGLIELKNKLEQL